MFSSSCPDEVSGPPGNLLRGGNGTISHEFPTFLGVSSHPTEQIVKSAIYKEHRTSIPGHSAVHFFSAMTIYLLTDKVFLKGTSLERHFDRLDVGSDDRNCISRRLLSTHGSFRAKTNTAKYHVKTTTATTNTVITTKPT